MFPYLHSASYLVIVLLQPGLALFPVYTPLIVHMHPPKSNGIKVLVLVHAVAAAQSPRSVCPKENRDTVTAAVSCLDYSFPALCSPFFPS